MRISLAVEKRNLFRTEHQPSIFTDIDTTIDNHDEIQTLDFGTKPVSNKCNSSIQANVISAERKAQLNYLKQKVKRKNDRI